MSKRRISNVAKSAPVKSRKSNSGSEGKQSDLQQLEKIFELMEKHEVTELEWEKKGERLKLKTRHAIPEHSLSMSGPGIATLASHRVSHEIVAHSEKTLHGTVRADVVSPGPEANTSKTPAVSSSQKQVV